jgi:hypothetical protein
VIHASRNKVFPSVAPGRFRDRLPQEFHTIPSRVAARQLGLRLLEQQVSTASSFRLTCNRRSGALETKPSYGLAHRGDQQDADNDGYGVSSGLHRPQ